MLNDISRLMRTQFDNRARDLGLTRSQWRVMVFLARSEGVNQSGLAEMIEVDRMTIGRLIDRLEASGWVERRPDASDRRVHRLYLTRAARPLLDKMIVLANDVQEAALEGLSTADRKKLGELLSAIMNNVSARQAANDAELSDGPRAARLGGSGD
ncbi:MAG: MarR family transcriptional regulator [Proteobacteria bacterium]|nr:MarR family transcriptional regulator [Pseudomonadota bacterium]